MRNVAATGADASPLAPDAAAAARTETGGVGMWLVGLLIAAAVGGGGWLALQPDRVRKRMLRSVRAAPKRLLALLRLRRAEKAPITSTWSTPGSAWIASACEDKDKDSDARAEGVGARRGTKRRRTGITNLTLPAIRIPIDKESDSTTTDGD
jgi:hypothetical protein